MSEITEQAGQMIREARLKAGLTQRELAGRLGISEGSYNRYENGKANLSLETVQKVVKAIGTSINVLFK